MKDLRTKSTFNDHAIFKGRTITANNNVTAKIENMLDFIGVPKDTNLIQKIAGHLSANSMEISINNVETFLKDNNIQRVADLRKKAEVLTVNQPINDEKLFLKNMGEKGYIEMTNRFLIKKFDDIEIDISKTNSNIEYISAYKNSKLLDEIPQDILQQVKEDINSSLF